MATKRPPSPDVRRYCERRGYSSRVSGGGLQYLIENWTRIVVGIEDGYRYLFDEIGTHATEEEWTEVEAILPLLDARFLRLQHNPSVHRYVSFMMALSLGYLFASVRHRTFDNLSFLAMGLVFICALLGMVIGAVTNGGQRV